MNNPQELANFFMQCLTENKNDTQENQGSSLKIGDNFIFIVGDTVLLFKRDVGKVIELVPCDEQNSECEILSKEFQIDNQIIELLYRK